MLLYFILGIIFISLVVPFLNFIASFFDIYLQYITYLYAYKIYKLKTLMKEDQEQEQQEKKNPIGFYTQAIGVQIPQNQEENY